MSLSIEQQVEIFKALLSESKYNLEKAEQDIVNAFVETIKQSKQQIPLDADDKKPSKKKTNRKKADHADQSDAAKKTRRKSGYSLFMSEKMAKDKMKMVEAVHAWKQLTKEEKTPWNDRAKELNKNLNTNVTENAAETEDLTSGLTGNVGETENVEIQSN